LFLVAAGMGIVDNGLILMNSVIKELVEKEEEKIIKKTEQENKKDKSTLKRRITDIQCREISYQLFIFRSWIRILTGTRIGASDHIKANN
jgi:hypothetical protein